MTQRRYGIVKVLGLLLITYVFAMFQGGFTSWFLFYSCLLFVCYELIAFVLMFASLQVTREINRDRLQDGEEVIVTIRMKRKLWFPFGWNVVAETLPDKLKLLYEPHRQLIFPWFKREIELNYVIPALPRGYYLLEECTVTGGDFFGFVQRSKKFALINEFLVYPAVKNLTHWPSGDGQISGNVHVSHLRSNDVSAVRGVREYQRGDRLSQIHWRASARGMGLKTKEFEHQAINQVVFFLDVEKEKYAGTDPNLFETAVKLTASLVYYTSRRQYPYGFVCQQRERMYIPPANTSVHFFRIFDQLAAVMPDGTEPFERVLSRNAMECPRGTTLAVVTPSLDKTILAQVIQLTSSGRSVQFFFVQAHPYVTDQERKALQLLSANKVMCKAIQLAEYDQLERIGGA